MSLIQYDPQGALLDSHGLAEGDLASLAAKLGDARDQVLSDLERFRSGQEVSQSDQPLDAGFTDLPERLLAEYRDRGEESQIGRIKRVADRLASEADRVVVLGIGGSYMGARALLESCCHPYHNELNRKDRGDRPRIYFEGNNVDNDSVQGLLDVLGRGTKPKIIDEKWGIVVISKSGGTLETATAFRRLLQALEEACTDNPEEVARLVVPVTGPSGRLFDLAAAIGCPDLFEIPDGVGGRFSIFTAVGLLPAAILGLDIVALLEGASAMNEHFRSAAVGQNVVLDYTGVCHLMENRRGAKTRILSTWGKGLEAAGLWYDQLLAESLGKKEQGALPLTVVNTRDLHSRGQQHQEGRRDKLITNLIVRQTNREPLTIGRSERDEDRLNELSEKTLPEVMDAALQGTNEAYAEDQRPTTNLWLPRLDERSMGQFFQMMMLSTVVEGRLIGINPYGQPGVEGYKRHMNRFLRGR